MNLTTYLRSLDDQALYRIRQWIDQEIACREAANKQQAIDDLQRTMSSYEFELHRGPDDN